MRRAQSLPIWSPPPLVEASVAPTAAELTTSPAKEDAPPALDDGDAGLCPSDDGGGGVADARRRCLSDGDGGFDDARRARHCRHVTFTSVRIREYSTILGDHPCCPSGPPLSLGWTMEREVHAEFEAYETERVPRRVRSKEELRLDGEERRGILRSLVVGGVAAAADATLSHDDPPSDDDVGRRKVGAGGECCRVYSQEELRKAERRLTRERACNSRSNRRMNRGFFRPLTPEERERGGIASAGEGGDVPQDSDEPGPGRPVIADGACAIGCACDDSTAMKDDSQPVVG